MNSSFETDGRLPWDYFADLRTSASADIVLPDDSSGRTTRVIRYNESLRLAHFDIAVALSERANGFTMVSASVASTMAIAHLNERNTTIVRDLDQRLQNCDLYFTQSAIDNTVNSKVATEKIMKRNADTGNPHSLAHPHPTAIVGPVMSYLADLQSVVSGILDLPQVGVATSSTLVRTDTTRPTWARTTASNFEDARAAALYFQSLGVTHVNCIYIEDVYGRTYASDFVQAASDLNITVATALFWGEESALRGDSVELALKQLSKTGYRYFFGIFLMQNMEQVMVTADTLGLVGDRYAWVLCEGLSSFVTGSYHPSSPQVANLFRGLAVLFLDVPQNPVFDRVLAETASDPDFQAFYLSTVDDREALVDFDYTGITSNMYIYTMYDAAMALGIAACQTSDQFFTGLELYESVLLSDFVGVSGRVRFEADTGSRKVEDLGFNVYNINLNANETDGSIVQRIQKTAHISGRNITALEPFYFFDGTTDIPLALKPVEEDLKLLGVGVRATGYALGGVMAILSLFLLGWVTFNRKKAIVEASQPFFLILLCMGTLIMSTSIFLLGLQEPMDAETLDRSCMAIPWLLSIGFVTSYVALFTKLRRLHKLVVSARRFRRVTIKPKEALVPFAILMSVNISILTAWTVVSPLRWTRSYTDSLDEFGRSTQSQGICSGVDDRSHWFAATIIALDFSAACLAGCQAYLARGHPREYKEGHYITLSVFGLLEAILLGIPIFIAAEQNDVIFLVWSVLIFVVCAALLLTPLSLVFHKKKPHLPDYSRANFSSPFELHLATQSSGVDQRNARPVDGGSSDERSSTEENT